MTRLSAAEEFLLDKVRRGDAEAWQQLVARFQGRLLAYARRELPDDADAEDVLQETFIGMLQTLPGFRGEATLETLLFRILRRRIADFFRRRGRQGDRSAPNSIPAPDALIPPAEIPSPIQPASWYTRREEQRSDLRSALSAAIQHVVSQLQNPPRFEELELVELLLGVQRRNKEVADLLGLDEKQVALRKHRLIHRLASYVARGTALDKTGELPDPPDHLLSDIWADDRPTCPKRSTLGKHLLGTLDSAWSQYVEFHLRVAACPFCRANLHDLQSDTDRRGNAEAASRILRSTIGFFRPS
jgi:RNA polymerase sigma factor (sigma-70 family)